jgi:coenzyme F420-0:L-glutamate ligase/coenzyme F420-1:gamma-L-glutamate ligase
MTRGITFSALPGIGNVAAGDDLAGILQTAIAAAGLTPAACDVLVVAQKIVSKAEGRTIDLESVVPSPRALELAAVTGKDARLVELVLAESSEVLRAVPNVLIVRHRLGYVMANAGIDHSNVMSRGGARTVLLLPLDADASAAALRDKLSAALGCELGVIVSDSFGRPWRNGVVNVALGAAGLPALIDRRGEKDLYGRTLEMTQVAFADALAAGAGLAMGEGAEGTPAVLVRGASWQAPPCNVQALIRPIEEDLFR